MVLANATAAESACDDVENLSPFSVLAYMELRNQLPAGPGAIVSADRYVERTFSIDKTRDICIQPFLLIVRTEWIVTAHRDTLGKGCDIYGEYHRILGVSSI